MADLNETLEEARKQNDSLSNLLDNVLTFLKENEAEYKAITNYVPRYAFLNLKIEFFKRSNMRTSKVIKFLLKIK